MFRIPILSAIKTVFTRPRHWVEALCIAIAIFALFVMVPVWTTPGNSIPFELHLIPWGVYILMIALALLNGVLIEMQLYIRRHQLAPATGKHAATAAGIAISSLFATIGCAACYSSLLALLGLGGTAFVVTNRWWFAATALGLTCVALVYTVRRVTGNCACEPLAKDSCTLL